MFSKVKNWLEQLIVFSSLSQWYSHIKNMDMSIFFTVSLVAHHHSSLYPSPLKWYDVIIFHASFITNRIPHIKEGVEYINRLVVQNLLYDRVICGG